LVLESRETRPGVWIGGVQPGEGQWGSAPTVVLAVAPAVVAGHAAPVPAAVHLPDRFGPLARAAAPAPLVAAEQALKAVAGGRSSSPETRPPLPSRAREAGPALLPPARRPAEPGVEVRGQGEINLSPTPTPSQVGRPLCLLSLAREQSRGHETAHAEGCKSSHCIPSPGLVLNHNATPEDLAPPESSRGRNSPVYCKLH
jgi:hypothetical protein